jgi:hypothetical protein
VGENIVELVEAMETVEDIFLVGDVQATCSFSNFLGYLLLLISRRILLLLPGFLRLLPSFLRLCFLGRLRPLLSALCWS